jgi:Tfp pilus assembly protein FimV
MLAVAGIVFALSNVATTHDAPLAVKTTASAANALNSAGTEGASRASPVGGSVYVVQPGDTLWSIARELRPTGDPRAEVDRLTDLNGTAALQVGQRLRLAPVPGS